MCVLPCADGERGGFAQTFGKGRTWEKMLIEAARPPKTFLDVILENAVYLKGDTVFFYFREKCRSPPPVLRFFEFKNKGGQANGKGI